MSRTKKYSKNIDATNSDEALAIAQGIKQENQTKAQTKLIAQGIRKGIELYKNQQNKKSRENDKRKKKELKNKLLETSSSDRSENQKSQNFTVLPIWIPWGLLLLTWLLILVYLNVS